MEKVKKLIYSDLYRFTKTTSKRNLLYYLFASQGFKFLFFYRLCVKYKRSTIIGFIAYQFYRRYTVRYGFQIPTTVQIGYGMFLPHFGFIVINGGCKIGDNCNILHGVTLGNTKGGKAPGVPVIGNEVYIGPSATVVGGITIGDRVLIAPNAYVNFDVPSDSIVLGNPAKIIPKENASESYINNLFIDLKNIKSY